MKTTSFSSKSLHEPLRHRAGMTLMEILVVICIIAVLAGIGFPTIRKIREKSQGVTCMSNLKQVGAAILMYATDNNNKLPPSPAYDTETAKDGDIWPLVVARAGYLWSDPDVGPPPCGKGVWTCPGCDYMSDAYGGYGVVENAIFVRENAIAEVTSQNGGKEKGSLRLTSIPDPSRTWLVGDAAQNNKNYKKGWYAIWSRPGEWDNSHCPAERHGGRANVCMFDGHVESLTTKQLKAGNYVIKNY